MRVADLDASGDALYMENINVSAGVLYNRRSPNGLDKDCLKLNHRYEPLTAALKYGWIGWCGGGL